MDENKERTEIKIVLDEKMMLRIGIGIGYGFGALLRGIRQGLEDYEIEEAAREMQAEDATSEMQKLEHKQKTEISDCRKCWCDTCAQLEGCQKARPGSEPDGIRPLPCIGCVNGMRFRPQEEEPCKEYEETASYNNE